MTISIKRKEAPIESITITRGGGFKPVVLTFTKSGKASIKVAKEGQQGTLFSVSEAKDLVSGINTLLGVSK